MYLVVGQQSHNYAEEVFLPVNIFFGIIQWSILVLIEVQLSVNYAHPLTVGVRDACIGVFVESLLTLSNLWDVGFALSVACARS